MTESNAARCPIAFDHDTSAHAKNWPHEYQAMREQCPRAWTENHGGFWIATRYKDIVGIAQRPDSFTTHKSFDPQTGEVQGGLTIPPLPSFRAVPNESESPEWDGVRGFLNRRFGPSAVEARRDRARHFAAAL